MPDLAVNELVSFKQWSNKREETFDDSVIPTTIGTVLRQEVAPLIDSKTYVIDWGEYRGLHYPNEVKIHKMYENTNEGKRAFIKDEKLKVIRSKKTNKIVAYRNSAGERLTLDEIRALFSKHLTTS